MTPKTTYTRGRRRRWRRGRQRPDRTAGSAVSDHWQAKGPHTQARRFGTPSKGAKGAPKGGKPSSASLTQKKATSTCRNCGQVGHWAKECPKGKGGQSSRVQITEEVAEEDDEHESYFVFTAEVEDVQPTAHLPRPPEAYLASATTSAGYMITDTECQKLCHGTEWRLEHEKLLRQYGLQCQTRPAQERFKFGAGKTQEANTKALIPCVLAGQPLVLHSSELKTGIPLLGSLSLMTYLGTVIDLGKGEAYFSKLKLKAPLAKLSNGHIAVNHPARHLASGQRRAGSTARPIPAAKSRGILQVGRRRGTGRPPHLPHRSWVRVRPPAFRLKQPLRPTRNSRHPPWSWPSFNA